MNSVFGLRFGEVVPSQYTDIPFDFVTQTAAVGDAEIQWLAASENMLTFTGGNDNDFDD